MPQVDPDQLHQHAGRLAALGDNVRAQAATEIEPLQLGSAPPAVWFAARIATAQGGISGNLQRYAQNLTVVGDNVTACAEDYRATDESGADTFRRLGND